MSTLHEDLFTFVIIPRSVILKMRNASDKSCRENQNTCFVINEFSFPKIVYGKIPYSQKGHTWRYNTAHAHCVLDTWVYKHTLTISNSYCFSTVTVVARMRLNITLYVHCLSC